MKKIILIKKNINKQKIRIDKFLFNNFKNKISRKEIQNYIYNGKILLNYNKIKKNKILKFNDKIILLFKFNKNKKKKIYSNKNLKVNIFYKDKNFIIINKKSGQIVHPGYGNYNNTLINWLKYYFKKKNIKQLNYNNYRYGLVHRLDKDTTGLLILAKNLKTYNFIKNEFINKKIIKKYIAIIWGIPKIKKNIIKNYIGRNIKNRIKMMVMNKKNEKYGKYSITKYKVIKTYKIFSLVKCKIETGRTHQIRVHFNYIGHPILNDKLYLNKNIKRKYINNLNNKKILKINKFLNRHALHAYYLKFKDPINKKYKKFKSKLPKDMLKCLKFFKKNF
ncbi:MAG: RluA family pseudouridine synthase [Candidatus Shikimatogenerans sp. JK-2022]|nr:RluA family pseudouridine synthase [Candidatus Shikimatogenerans bostrichidophilus]